METKDSNNIKTRHLKHKMLCVFVLVISLCSLNVEGLLKLNVPRVRLPYFDNLSVNFTLSVDNPGQGCYQWSVSRSDVITLSTPDSDYNQDIYQDGVKCSSRAIISTVPRVSPCCPASAIVYAEDSKTHEIVRCDVIIDRIHSVSIVTTTKELHLEEAPSKFHIRGYGSKNNEFSTLDGIPIRWLLETTKETVSATDPQSIMRFLPFSESTYQAPPGVAVLEANRQQGSTVLIEGIKTGSAVVIARLIDPLYKSIEARVRIVVVANINVEPSEVYIVPGTVIPLKLKQVKHGKLNYIALPSNSYEFFVSNSTVVSYDLSKSLITALEYGETKIVVKDKNCLEEMEEEHPEALTAYIHVRQPKFLSLTVYPNRNWALVINRQYEVQVDVYDSDNQKILVTDNVVVETIFDKNAFRVEQSSPNGTYHVGVPIKQGSATVSAALKYTLRDGSPVVPIQPVKIKAEMEIYQNIALNPKETILPWDPTIQSKYDLRWNPSGGTGHFVWSSTNTSVLTVTQSGTGKTETIGFANVTAASSVNSNIYGQAKVYVLSPVSMEIVDHIVEAEVGIPIQVPLAFYAIRPDDSTKTPRPFSSCGTLPFNVNVEDPNFSYDSKTHYPHLKPACTVLPVIGNTLGSSLVTVTYKIANHVFSDSVTVSTFKSLNVIEPTNRIIVLAVGSSKQLAFEGGPRPLLEKHAGFFKTVDLIDNTIVSGKEINMRENAPDDLYVYEVLCTDIGETDVVFRIGNNQTSESSKPVIRTAVVTVVCAEPAQMYFKVETTVRSRCPNDASSAQVVRVSVPNYEDTLISLTVKDDKGRKFDNITSLNIQWTANKEDLVEFATPEFVTTERIDGNGYTMVGKSYQILHPKKKSGNVEVTAEIKGYRKDILAAAKIGRRLLNPVLTTDGYSETQHSMDLILVADLSVEPSPINVFNHPSAKVVVKVTEGSGHFELDTVGSSIIAFKYHEVNRTIDIFPLEEGSTRIIIRDLCLSTKPVVEVDVQVNGVGRIVVTVDDKIQVNSETELTVKVLDHSGNPLSPELLSLVKLRPLPMNSEAIELVPVDDKNIKNTIVTYKVKGKHVGHSIVSFVADGVGVLGKMARSVPKTVTVFPPLSLRPRNITMLVGSVYQVMAVGGPQPDSSTVFTLERDHILHVNSNGLILAKAVGSSSIFGKSVERHPSGGKTYSEDAIHVNVIPLNGIRIRCAINRIQTDGEVPLWAVGIGQGVEPFIFLGSHAPLATFEWTVSNRETGEILHLFQKNGYMPSAGDQVGVRFKAKQPGHVTIRLSMVFADKMYTDETEIEVYEELRLLKVPHSCRAILMTPNSELSLKTNRDTSGLVTYAVQLSRSPACNERSETCTNARATTERPVVTVDNAGNVKSSETTGQTVVLVSVHEEFGIVQSISVTIEVKPISFMMANPELPINFVSKDKSSLPLGVAFPFYITYHDNVGRTFDATNSVPKIRPNRFDLVQVNSGTENNTFIVQTLSEGRTGLKVYDDLNPHLSEYLILSVAEAIDPKLALGVMFVGDVVCFSCAIKSSDMKGGKWSVEPKNLIKLNPSNGLGIALSSGKVRIDYTIPGVGSVTSADITVTGVASLTFAKSTIPESITNGDLSAVFDVVVNIGDKIDNLAGANCSRELIPQDIQAPFSCHMYFENKDVAHMLDAIFTVQPTFIYEKKRYACRIQPKTNEPSKIYTSLVETNLILYAKVLLDATETKRGFDANEQKEIETESVKILFHPSLYIKTTQLQMSTSRTSTNLILTGLSRILDQVEIQPSSINGINHLEIGSYTTESPFSHHSPNIEDKNQVPILEFCETRVYPITLLSKYWSSGLNTDETLTITVVSKITKQTLLIPVKLKIMSSFMDMQPTTSSAFDFFSSKIEFAIGSLAALVGVLAAFYFAAVVIGRSASVSYTDTTLFLPNGGTPTGVFNNLRYTPNAIHTPLSGSPRSSTSGSFKSPNNSPINAFGDVASSPSNYRLYSTNDPGYKRSPHSLNH